MKKYHYAILILIVLESIAFASGDVDNNGIVDLADAVLSLQVCVSMTPSTVNASADVNADEKIGLEEAIYVLQKVSTQDTVHIAQTARGSDTGDSPANAHSVAWLNNPANWGSGDGQVGPGKMVRFHDEITTQIIIAGDGSSGSTIVLDFSDASMNSADSSMVAGVLKIVQIDVNGHDYITLTNIDFSSSIISGYLFSLGGGSTAHLTIRNCNYQGPADSQVECIYHNYGVNTLIENNTFINVMYGITGNTTFNHDIIIRNNQILGSSGAVDRVQDIIIFGDVYNLTIEGNHLSIRKANSASPPYNDHHCDVIQTFKSGSAYSQNPHDWTIRYNLIELNTDNRYHRSWSMAANLDGNFFIYGNIFLGIDGGGYGNGLLLAPATDSSEFNAYIYGNTFVSKNGPGNMLRLVSDDPSHAFHVKNNIVYSYDYAPNAIMTRPPALSASNNIYHVANGFFGPVPNPLGGDPILVDCETWINSEETDSYCIDPQFIDYDNNNYGLTPASPAIDNGIVLDVLFSKALSSSIFFPNPPLIERPQDSAWDIGAIENSPQQSLEKLLRLPIRR